MKKPVSKWALFMWVVAGGYLLQAISAYVAEVGDKISDLGYLMQSVEMEQYFVNILRPAILSAPMAIGIGVLIEIADQIRWNQLSTDAQAAERLKRSWLRRPSG